MASTSVRFPKAPTEFPMILINVFSVGHDLASLKTLSCGRKWYSMKQKPPPDLWWTCLKWNPYQSEGAEDGQTLHVRQTELHQTQTDDQTVKDVPALLKVIIRIQSDYLQDHLCCEDPSEDLRTHHQTRQNTFTCVFSSYLPRIQYRYLLNTYIEYNFWIIPL